MLIADIFVDTFTVYQITCVTGDFFVIPFSVQNHICICIMQWEQQLC